mgnify:CR=1 FL=1
MVSYEVNYSPIKFQDKILGNVEVIKKNVNRLVLFSTPFILDDSSEHGAHIWSKSGILICRRHLVTSIELSNISPPSLSLNERINLIGVLGLKTPEPIIEYHRRTDALFFCAQLVKISFLSPTLCNSSGSIIKKCVEVMLPKKKSEWGI